MGAEVGYPNRIKLTIIQQIYTYAPEFSGMEWGGGGGVSILMTSSFTFRPFITTKTHNFWVRRKIGSIKNCTKRPAVLKSLLKAE